MASKDQWGQLVSKVRLDHLELVYQDELASVVIPANQVGYIIHLASFP